MQRTRVHTVLGELADAKARADRAQEAIASAHPLVTSLLVQTSMTPHERQQLGLTLAATLGVQNLPPAVAALTSQPSMFRQQSVALLSQGSGLSLGSPLPPWNLSSPRRATAPKSGWLSRGSSLAPGFSVAQSPKEHAKPRTRLGEASPVPEPQPEPVPDPYPEQPQMASRMPTPRASDAEQVPSSARDVHPTHLTPAILQHAFWGIMAVSRICAPKWTDVGCWMVSVSEMAVP